MPGTTRTPVSATLFAYQVGFGDCFLLRFTYADGKKRHLLIDFGTTKLPDWATSEHMVQIARDIEEKCGGKLEAVVATHRHADHISGFATKADGSGSGDIIKLLGPGVVVQPWTEAPEAPIDSLGPDPDQGRQNFARRRQSLAHMHAVAEMAAQAAESGRVNMSKQVAAQMSFIGQDNIANLSAVQNLQEMGKRHVYAFHGSNAGLGRLLPGVKVTVLGPPTLHQTDSIRKQRSRDEDEFWHLAPKRMAGALDQIGNDKLLFPYATYRRASGMRTEHRWLRDRVDAANAEQLLGVVRALDKQMNNTSLILLFQAGSKTLLFPGDAQLENWQYALQSDLARLLDKVDVYKVGHHGSLNATPQSLWKRFTRRGHKSKPDRLTSVMSTLAGKHGSPSNNTEVPREPLVRALQSDSHLHSTQNLAAPQLCEMIEIDLT